MSCHGESCGYVPSCGHIWGRESEATMAALGQSHRQAVPLQRFPSAFPVGFKEKEAPGSFWSKDEHNLSIQAARAGSPCACPACSSRAAPHPGATWSRNLTVEVFCLLPQF